MAQEAHIISQSRQKVAQAMLSGQPHAGQRVLPGAMLTVYQVHVLYSCPSCFEGTVLIEEHCSWQCTGRHQKPIYLLRKCWGSPAKKTRFVPGLYPGFVKPYKQTILALLSAGPFV